MAIAAITSIVLNKFDDILNEEPNLLNGVRNEVESIKVELQKIQRILIVEREEAIPPETRIWIARAKELVFETEDILDTFISWKEQRRKQKYTFFIHFRNNFSNKLKRIHPKFDISSQERLRYDINPPEDRDETSNLINKRTQNLPVAKEVDVIGLDDDKKLSVSRLNDEEISSQERLRYGINPPEDRDETSNSINRGTQNLPVAKEVGVIGLDDDKKLSVSRLIHEEISSQERLSIGINPPEDRDETSNSTNRGTQNLPVAKEVTQTFIEEADAIGLEDDVKLLVSRLIDEENVPEGRVISIVGMGGLGKTTLAKLVYNHRRIVDHFENRCWIYVSQDYSLIEILNNLKKWKAETYKVYISLRNERCLFVLDDVCDAKAYREIEALLPDTGKGSRILLTTRRREVALMADANPRSHPHEMKLLSADDSWMLLLRWAGYNEKSFPSDQIKVGKEIANKCRGLPLAIKTVGGLMYRNRSEWSMLLESLRAAQENIPAAQENIRAAQENIPAAQESIRAAQENIDADYFSKILKLSYTDLPSHLMLLYLYLLFFPQESEVPLRRIFGLWLAEGFLTGKHEKVLTGKHEKVNPEELAQVYLQELIDRNMIQVVKLKLDGKPKTCRVAGLLRDEFLSKAREMGLFQNQHNSLAPPTSGVRHLVEYTDINDNLSLELFKNSRSYISFNFRKGDIPAEVTGQILRKVIQRHMFRLLGVLDLERVYKPKLPDSLGKLHLLKYLGLRWTFLDAIPSSVGDLLNLETLDVKHTYISRLPSSIRKMKKLKHLYLNEIHLDLSAGDISLKNLQTLWGLTADMENPTKQKLNRLITLTKLGLTVENTLVKVYAKWISRLTALRILRFRSRDEYGRPSDLKLGSFSSLSHLYDLYLLGKLTKENPLHALELPDSLTVLTLSVSQLQEDPMPTLEKLPNLRALRLFAHSYTGKRMECSKKGFPSLRILKLWMLVELEEWIIDKEAMSCLTQLEIRCCKKLKKCPMNMLQLPKLRDLILLNMSKDFVAEVEARKGENVLLTPDNWDFPTFLDQESSHGGEGSG